MAETIVITLRQPWATLIEMGYKTIVVLDGLSRLVGHTVAIHGDRRWDSSARLSVERALGCSVKAGLGVSWDRIRRKALEDRGSIKVIAKATEYRPLTSADAKAALCYVHGRSGLVLENVRPVVPVSTAGSCVPVWLLPAGVIEERR